jgi:hypothetical protein
VVDKLQLEGSSTFSGNSSCNMGFNIRMSASGPLVSTGVLLASPERNPERANFSRGVANRSFQTVP